MVGALLGLAGPAQAQDDGDADDDLLGDDGISEVVTEVRGTLRAVDDDGDDVFLEGVELIVSTAEGDEVGTAVSDADGNWRLDLPGAGEYSTLLVIESLPEGAVLRNPDNNPLNFRVNEGDSRPNLFPMGDAPVATSGAGTVRIVQLSIDGLKLGLLIAICAVGLSLIYGTTGLTNFAHGEMVTFGAMTAYLFHVSSVFGWQSSLILAAVIATVAGGVAGGIFNRGVWRPLRRRGASLVSMLVVSIGFAILIRYVLLYIFGGRDGFYRDFRIQSRIDFGWFAITPRDLVIMVVSTIILVLVASALTYTRMGKAMRAVADNRDLAASSGIDVERVISVVWIAGSALAALGGVLFAATEAVGWEMGFRILLLMFAAVTLGGLGTAYGALLGGLVIGVFIQTSTIIIPSDMKNVGALLVLVIVLLVRPQGILGRPERIG